MTAQRHFHLEPLAATFGAVVTGLKLAMISDQAFPTLYKAWLDYALLIFPGQHLSNAQQITLARRFGKLEFDLFAISNVKDDGSLRTSDDDDLVKLKHAILPDHRNGASYVVNDSVEEVLELTKDGFGRPLFRASTANGPFDRLVGFPYTVGTNLPALGAPADTIFGNLKLYFLAMEEEITMARSSEFKFRTNLIAFKIFSVVGGRLLEPLGVSILDNAAS